MLARARASHYAATMNTFDATAPYLRLPGRAVYLLCRITGWIAMLVFVAAFASLVDGLVAEMRMGMNRLDMLPGTETAVSGPMPVKTAEPGDFYVQGNAPDGQVRLVLEGFFSSYWFGSGMWRGHFAVGDTPGIGDYPFVVEFKDAPPRSAQTFYVVVWPDAEALRAGSFSFVYRESGLKPFVVAPVMGGIGLLLGVINFLLGRYWTGRLKAAGCGEVYKIAQGGNDLIDVTCGIGADGGLVEGQECVICRPEGRPVARGRVTRCDSRHATLALPADSGVMSGDVVCPVRGERAASDAV